MSDPISTYNRIKFDMDNPASSHKTILTNAEELVDVKNSVELLSDLSDYAYTKGRVELGGALYELSLLASKIRESNSDFYSMINDKKQFPETNIFWNKKEAVQNIITLNTNLSGYPEALLTSLYKSIYKTNWDSLINEEENQALLRHNKDNIWKIRNYCISKTDTVFLKLTEKSAEDITSGEKIYSNNGLRKVLTVISSGDYKKFYIEGQLEPLELPRNVKAIILP